MSRQRRQNRDLLDHVVPLPISSLQLTFLADLTLTEDYIYHAVSSGSFSNYLGQPSDVCKDQGLVKLLHGKVQPVKKSVHLA